MVPRSTHHCCCCRDDQQCRLCEFLLELWSLIFECLIKWLDAVRGSLYLLGISPTDFASFPHPFASFPQQICFISPTNCFVSPTKCCISPTNCCISPTIFSFPQHNFVSLCQKIKSSKFRHLLIKIRIPDICDSGHGDDRLKSVPNDPPHLMAPLLVV